MTRHPRSLCVGTGSRSFIALRLMNWRESDVKQQACEGSGLLNSWACLCCASNMNAVICASSKFNAVMR